MLEPLDYANRDQGMMYLGCSLREFLPEDHLLLEVERAVDLRGLVRPFTEVYCPDNGRPAVHPEILVRALLLSRIYGIPSFRKLCEEIGLNLAYRYFCHLPLHQPVFDHSTITRFLDRVGREAFETLCRNLTQLLAERGFLSRDTYLDSTLLEANASSDGRGRTSASAEAFAESVVETNGLFQGPAGPEADAAVRRYQDRQGQLSLPDSDPDARWAKGARGAPRLTYKVSALADDHGFLIGQRVDLATVADHVAGQALLDGLPPPAALAADTAYSAGAFRAVLRRRGIAGYIPLPADHPPAFLQAEDFRFGPFTMTCAEGVHLRAYHRPDRPNNVRYSAPKRECGPCPRRARCPAARQSGFTLSAYARELVAAQAVNERAAYRHAQRRRRTVIEGIFAQMKSRGLRRVKLRTLRRVAIEVALAAFAHNVLKLVRLNRRPQPVGATGAKPLRHRTSVSLRRALRHSCRRRAFSTGPDGRPSR